jgi:predicted lysophospholipase L1 biosynthesis ABC-type transport system permease subunit
MCSPLIYAALGIGVGSVGIGAAFSEQAKKNLAADQAVADMLNAPARAREEARRRALFEQSRRDVPVPTRSTPGASGNY